jgi:hypothetical protein
MTELSQLDADIQNIIQALRANGYTGSMEEQILRKSLETLLRKRVKVMDLMGVY